MGCSKRNWNRHVSPSLSSHPIPFLSIAVGRAPREKKKQRKKKYRGKKKTHTHTHTHEKKRKERKKEQKSCPIFIMFLRGAQAAASLPVTSLSISKKVWKKKICPWWYRVVAKHALTFCQFRKREQEKQNIFSRFFCTFPAEKKKGGNKRRE